MFRAFFVVVAALAASCSEPKPLITVTEARVVATPASAAAYFTLTNSGGSDRLVAAAAPGVGAASLHETSMDRGIMRMRPIAGGISVEKGKSVRFTPYGKHVMIMLERPLDPAKAVPLKLTFERQGMVAVNAWGPGPGAAFGGYKASGNGREGGVFGLKDFMEVKSISGIPA